MLDFVFAAAYGRCSQFLLCALMLKFDSRIQMSLARNDQARPYLTHVTGCPGGCEDQGG
jgi:hypothetical protein